MDKSSTLSKDAFQEALQRARQLAARISQPGSAGVKRPLEEDDRNSPEPKRIDSIGSHLAVMKEGQKPQRNQLYLDGVVYNGEKTLDMMVPGNKVGIIIGKGGEMIRTLQDRASVRMIIFQDSTQSSDQDKQMRIIGAPEKVDYAKQLVQDLLVEKDLETAVRQRNPSKINSALNEYGSSRITFYEYPVPPTTIGLVIGKGGETIRKIQAESGCKVQFDSNKIDQQGNKICQFTGTQDSVNKAVELVKEIVDQASGGTTGNFEEVRLVVPASRTGTVIGRGGENIRALKQDSGCNIELDKNFRSDNDEKCFIIRGTPDKITYAQQLVTDKVGGHVTVLSSTIQSNPLYKSSQYPGYQLYGQSTGVPSYWPAQTAADTTTNQSQDQYAMWAQYYAQYAAYSQQTATPSTTSVASGTTTNGTSTSSQQDGEAIYKQWIDYYKACNMTKEAEDMEKKLKEYINAKNAVEQNESKSQNGKED